jgi:hypothetical protein
LDSHLAKLYYYRHIAWRLGPNAITYGGWRRYNIPIAVWYDVCMNSDGDKVYMKIVAFAEIYNFVVQTFFISIVHTKKLQFFENELIATAV